jgi:hypothetical protein
MAFGVVLFGDCGKEGVVAVEAGEVAVGGDVGQEQFALFYFVEFEGGFGLHAADLIVLDEFAHFFLLDTALSQFNWLHHLLPRPNVDFLQLYFHA